VIAHVPRQAWLAGDLLAADRVVRAAEDQGAVWLRADPDLWDEVLLRYQRLCPIGNRSSTTAAFFRVVRAHRALHDVREPLTRADLEHAVDTWQWALRLAPEAGVEVQLAALLHDVERLERDPRAGRAARAMALVDGGPWSASRVADLVAGHEAPGDDPDVQLLADADGLSFFASGCAAYLAWSGEATTAHKAWSKLDRLSDAAREWLPRLRLPAGLRF
jgi:hypothetical protein